MIIGPAVRATNPNAQGRTNRYAAHVSRLRNADIQRRALVRGPGADSIATLAKARLSSKEPVLLRLVDRRLRLSLRLPQCCGGTLLPGEDAIDRVVHRG